MAGSRGSRPADREEPNRVLGFPVSGRSRARQGAEPRRDREAGTPVAARDSQPSAARSTEPQRVLGFPVDWFRSGGQGREMSLARSLHAARRLLRRPGGSE